MKKTDLYLKPGTYIKSSTAVGDIQGISLENFVVSVLNNPTCCAKPSFIKDGMLMTDTFLSTSLQTVKDQGTNSSPLKLSTTLVRVESNLEVAERLLIEADSTVTTQTSSVIQSSTTNASLVIAPNGTGALIADIPDGAATGGNARGTNAVDLQMGRTNANEVASGPSSFVVGSNSKAQGVNSAAIGGSCSSTDLGAFSSGIGSQATGQYSFASGAFSQATNIISVAMGQSIASGQYAISLGNNNTASSNNSVVSGGQSNTASTNGHATVAGGQSNTASGTHSTVVGGQSNTASGPHSVSGGNSSVASGSQSVALGSNATASGTYSTSLGRFANATGENSKNISTNSTASGAYSAILGGYDSSITGTSAIALGYNHIAAGTYGLATGSSANAYLYAQNSLSSGAFSTRGDSQQSLLTPFKSAALTTAATTVLSLDGTGITNLIIPSGNNRAWNVQVNWVAVVTTITGTATGITVGDVITSIDLLAFKKIGGVSSASAHTSTATKLMVTTPAAYAACAIAYTAGASQEMALTFTGPTFVGAGSVTMRVVARIELAEVAF